MLNYEHVILKRLANCYRGLQELYDEQAPDDVIKFRWHKVLVYKSILKAVYGESFTLLLEDDIFIAYCSYISFTVNFDDSSIVVTNNELLHI